MTDTETTLEQKAPFEEHPLYQAAMKRMNNGDLPGAVSRLRRLTKHFPQDRALQDLLVRTELRITLADSEPSATPHRQPTPVLRRVVFFLLITTIFLAILVTFGLAYDRIVSPTRLRNEQAVIVNSLRQEGQQRFEAGDWAGAREAWQDVLTHVPGDPTAQAGVEQTYQQEELAELYSQARAAEEQGDWQGALDALQQIQAQSPGYRDVSQRIESAQGQLALRSAWQEALALVQAEDWSQAISVLTQIRKQDPSFQRSQVEEALFTAYVQLAGQKINQANGDPNLLREAVRYLDEALALRPTDQELIRERRLAAQFVAGAEAYAQENWVEAVESWELVYEQQPDYQDGVLRAPLYQTYPRAARQLIDQANGDLADLRKAMDYLDRAIAADPDNQSLIQTRDLAAAFVAGAEAFADEQWDVAISRWGPVYTSQPDYQGGVLESRLRQACGRSSSPDPELCPP